MQRTKVNIPIVVALCLLCLTLLSAHFTSGLYAKYTSVVTAADTARVASFYIDTDVDYVQLGIDDDQPLAFELGGTGEITSVPIPFYIESRSEVTVAYSVTATFDVALPEYVTLTLTDGTKTETLSADGAKTQFVFADFGDMDAYAGTPLRDELTLHIAVSDLDQITSQVQIPHASLIVKVYQTDA